MSEIKLPPIPEALKSKSFFGKHMIGKITMLMENYATAAIEFDRKGRREVAPGAEVRALIANMAAFLVASGDPYAEPLIKHAKELLSQPADPVVKESLTVAEPVKCDLNAGCPVPPLGWHCTRVSGHDGPCAAVEAPEEIELVKRGMDRLRAVQTADPAMAGDEWLKELDAILFKAANAFTRHYTPQILEHARKRVQPASREDAK